MGVTLFLIDTIGLPSLLVSIMTGVGAGLFALLAIAITFGLFTVIVVNWWVRALFFSGWVVYYQYRCMPVHYWLDKSYIEKHRYTWGVRFILQMVCSPLKMMGLGTSELQMGDISFNFRRYWPRCFISTDLQKFIENGYKVPGDSADA